MLEKRSRLLTLMDNEISQKRGQMSDEESDLLARTFFILKFLVITRLHRIYSRQPMLSKRQNRATQDPIKNGDWSYIEVFEFPNVLVV